MCAEYWGLYNHPPLWHLINYSSKGFPETLISSLFGLSGDKKIKKTARFVNENNTFLLSKIQEITLQVEHEFLKLNLNVT